MTTSRKEMLKIREEKKKAIIAARDERDYQEELIRLAGIYNMPVAYARIATELSTRKGKINQDQLSFHLAEMSKKNKAKK